MCKYTATNNAVFLIDSGASVSGVSQTSFLDDPQLCQVPITPAFGEVIHAKAKGTIRDSILGQLGVPALHIPNMHKNLLSVHQVCTGGRSKVQQIGIFTSEGCRFYPLETNRDVLKLLCDRPRTLQGLADQGVYLYSANTPGQQC